MTLENIYARCVKELEAVDIRIGKVAIIRYNPRLRTTFGRCERTGAGFAISVNNVFENHEDEYESELMNVVLHELIHTCKGCFNHGYLFKGYAVRVNARFGHHVSTYASEEYLKKLGIERKKMAAKYAVQCTACGKQYARKTLSKVIAHPEKYRCQCGEKLKRAV